MINQFNTMKPQSPVEQDFIWVAEYLNGTCYPEYDFVTKQENSFYSIDKQQLLRYGLLGRDMTFYYDVATGIFNIVGNEIEVMYITKDKEYNLTGQYVMYNDIIQYKTSETDFNDCRGFRSDIVEYNFGYKAQLNIEGVNFGFKAIFNIPLNQPMKFDFRLVSDTKLEGEFIIRKNGIVVFNDKAPLDENVGGEVEWVMR